MLSRARKCQCAPVRWPLGWRSSCATFDFVNKPAALRAGNHEARCVDFSSRVVPHRPAGNVGIKVVALLNFKSFCQKRLRHFEVVSHKLFAKLRLIAGVHNSP